MEARYHYFMSSKNEPKHEITRKELKKLLAGTGHCAKQIHIANGIYMSVADYDAAERAIRSAQRSSGGTIWSCGSFSLYLEHDRAYERRMRDSRYPDPAVRRKGSR